MGSSDVRSQPEPEPDRQPGRDGHDHDHDHDHGHRRGLRGALRAIVRPHSHDVADSVDTALESSRQGIRAVKISLAGLGVTAVLQLAIVALSGSVALLADTIHNFADALTAVPLWIAFVVGRRAASRRYTYGLGRLEDLAGVFIVVMIALSAVVAGWQSVERLVQPEEVDALGLVAIAGVIGFIGNELVAIYRIRVGRRIGSAALVADGLHARTDGLTSLGVVVGAGGVALGFERADPVVGLLITVAILLVLRTAVRDIYRRLMDGVDPELVHQAESILAATPGVLGVEGVRLRWIGHRLRLEAGVVVNHSLSLAAAHHIGEDARHRLLHGVSRLGDAHIHISPQDHDGVDYHEGVAHHFRD